MSKDKQNNPEKSQQEQEQDYINSQTPGFSQQGSTGTNPDGREGYDSKSQDINDHKNFNTPGNNTDKDKASDS